MESNSSNEKPILRENVRKGAKPRSVKKQSKKFEAKTKNSTRKKSQQTSRDLEWAGNSAVAKFFSTELSDNDEKLVEEESSQGFDFTNLESPKTERSSKENEFKFSSQNEPGENNNEKVNIDFSWATRERARSDSESFSWVESPKIIRHRPVVSMMQEADFFVPKAKAKTRTAVPKPKKINRHNCNDENDVTYIRKNATGNMSKHRPEACIPMSVVSERYQDQIYTPVLPEDELYRFGEVYESNLLHLIHKYLEVDTFHRVVYVGPEKGSIAPQMEKYFCLINEIQSVYPGKIDYADVKENKKLLAFKIAHVGAEQFFSQAATNDTYKSAPFHRIIFHDAVHYFNDMPKTFENSLKVLHKFGKVLIIHRAGALNTLPYFNSARGRIAEDDIPYMKIITALQKLGADVEWDLVHVPIVIPTAKWLAMLKAKYPPQMEIMSNYEITCGLRELAEGPLKYLQGSEMELEDRLMFITASLPTFDCAYPSVQRVGGASQVPYSGAADSKYYLPVTEDVKVFLDKAKEPANKTKSLF